ncbi:hypothetical protein ACTI_07710 [Actinoplanes sp. OR16]|nr:hypothetical protein ACTI_07710 [Actinoplanes sp. OR16]
MDMDRAAPSVPKTWSSIIRFRVGDSCTDPFGLLIAALTDSTRIAPGYNEAATRRAG